MEQGKAPADVSQWSYGSWHVIDLEHPLGRISALYRPHRRHRPQPLSGDTIDGEAGGPRLWALAAIHHGLEQHRRVDGKHRAGRERQPVQPVLPRPVERLLRRNDRSRCRSARQPWPRRHGTRCGCCHEGIRESGIGDQGSASDPRAFASGDRSGCSLAPRSFCSPRLSQSRRSYSAATPADTTSTFIWSRGSTR